MVKILYSFIFTWALFVSAAIVIMSVANQQVFNMKW
jgi:hypothetical protein